MHADLPVRNFLDELAARAPTPGGGSASALIGALGAALGSMSAVFSTGEKFKATEAQAREALEKLEALRARLTALIEDDIRAYRAYAQARKLPKETEAEKAARKQAIAQATEEATRVPEAILAAACEGFAALEHLAPVCNPNLAGDAAAAAYALEAAARGAGIQVQGNLANDPASAARRAEATRKIESCAAARVRIEAAVLKAMGLGADT